MQKFWDNSASPVAARDRAPAHIRPSVNIGSIAIAPATVLAPMAGVTDTVFRRFVRNMNFGNWSAEDELDKSACGLVMTEFTSADGVLRARDHRNQKMLDRYLHFYPDEHPISSQLFGSDPRVLADAARMVEDLGFDLVDLNLGCPAKKVVKCNGGSGLLRDLPLLASIFRQVRAAVRIPFTVKFRLGWSDSEIVCVELARIAEDCGLNAVALHARTREQGYSGNARWEWIAAVKNAVKIPVIGNGDIRSPEDAAAMFAVTGCDAVMIGRTAASNPWIFRQIAQYAAAGRYDEPSEADRYELIRTYFQMLVEECMPGAAGKMKQFASWFTHGVQNGAVLRKAVYEARHEHEILDRVDAFFCETLATPVSASAQGAAESLQCANLLDSPWLSEGL